MDNSKRTKPFFFYVISTEMPYKPRRLQEPPLIRKIRKYKAMFLNKYYLKAYGTYLNFLLPTIVTMSNRDQRIPT